LREIRNSRRISQEQLALEADLDRTYISLLERGLRNPTLRIILQLAEVLDTPVSQIIVQMESHLATQPKPSRAKR